MAAFEMVVFNLSSKTPHGTGILGPLEAMETGPRTSDPGPRTPLSYEWTLYAFYYLFDSPANDICPFTKIRKT